MARKQRDTFSDINITPLTDIFLVLLIIMMVVAPMLDRQGLHLSVPSEQEVENPKENKLVIIDVANDGSYSMDGEKISKDSLMFKIKDAAKEKKDGLLIRAQDDATHGAVVAVMDAARNAGVTAVSVSDS